MHFERCWLVHPRPPHLLAWQYLLRLWLMRHLLPRLQYYLPRLTPLCPPRQLHHPQLRRLRAQSLPQGQVSPVSERY